MNDLNLPTAEEVIQAYRQTGLKPATLHAEPREGTCCALGVLGSLKGLDIREFRTLTLFAQEAGVAGDSLRFALGFDGAGASQHWSPNERAAYEHGRTVHTACRAEFGEFSFYGPCNA